MKDAANADDPANLSSQPWAEGRLKDNVEKQAKARICDGRAELAEVQRVMRDDWTRLYCEWIGPLPPKT